MVSKKTIILKPTDSLPFKPAEKINKEDWYDTSFSHSKKSIGELRLPGVSNGRYDTKHPIQNNNGELVGYLSGAQTSLGYTWNCVYTGNCFWLTNQTFSDTFGGGVNRSNVSIVDEVGYFLFSPTKKFRVVKSFDFDSIWASSSIAFKIIYERNLFYLSNKGFCLFDTLSRTKISHVNFPYYLSNHEFDFTISPKVKILAIVGSASIGEKDPIDGKVLYNNFIWLYNLETGILMGEEKLENKDYLKWSIDFSEDGRNVRISSDISTLQFNLEAIN